MLLLYLPNKKDTVTNNLVFILFNISYALCTFGVKQLQPDTLYM